MLICPDLHCPWEHPKALEHCLRLRDRFKTDVFVNLGDEIDAGSMSLKYAANPNLPSPKDEIELAIESLSRWYDEFSECELIESNHGSRIHRKATGCGIPELALKAYLSLIEAPSGWHFRELSYEIDGVTYIHGEGFSASSWRSAFHKMKSSVIMGHLHSNAGIQWSTSRRHKQFAANMGCLIQSEHPAFNYARFAHERACLGAGICIDGEEPYWIPMPDKMINASK